MTRKSESTNLSRDNSSREIGRNMASFVLFVFRLVKDHHTLLHYILTTFEEDMYQTSSDRRATPPEEKHDQSTS